MSTNESNPSNRSGGENMSGQPRGLNYYQAKLAQMPGWPATWMTIELLPRKGEKGKIAALELHNASWRIEQGIVRKNQQTAGGENPSTKITPDNHVFLDPLLNLNLMQPDGFVDETVRVLALLGIVIKKDELNEEVRVDLLNPRDRTEPFEPIS